MFEQMDDKKISIIGTVNFDRAVLIKPVTSEKFQIVDGKHSNEEVSDFAVLVMGEVVMTSSYYSKIYSYVERLLLDDLI